jgi:type II secretion system protein G
MPDFTYEALDKSGTATKGTVSARDSQEAAVRVRALGVYPTKIADGKASSSRETAAASAGDGKLITTGKKVGRLEILLFTREMADLLDAGLPMDRAFSVLIDQTDSTPLKALLGTMQGDIRAGQPLSDALEKFPREFPKLYANMVRAGEVSGQLASVMTRLAEFMEKEQVRRSQISAALTYPAVLIAIAVSAVTFLLTFVIPKLSGIFKDLGSDLPVTTRILLSLSDILSHQWWLILLIITGVVLGFRGWLRTDAGLRTFDQIRLNVPIVGRQYRRDRRDPARTWRCAAGRDAARVDVEDRRVPSGRATHDGGRRRDGPAPAHADSHGRNAGLRGGQHDAADDVTRGAARRRSYGWICWICRPVHPFADIPGQLARQIWRRSVRPVPAIRTNGHSRPQSRIARWVTYSRHTRRATCPEENRTVIATTLTRTSRLSRRSRAFTLIEILVVVVILAVLAAVVVPNVIKKIGEGRKSAAGADITNFSSALQMYYADTGHYPTTEQGLNALLQNVGNEPKWKGPYLHNESSIRPDPWGHQYKYVEPGPNGEDFQIASEGDGEAITSDTVKQNR